MSALPMPARREFACAVVIDTQGRFLLQQRDNVPGIVHPGKVALFGGHREGDETYLACVVREIHEELSFFIEPELFEYLASLDGIDIDVEGGQIRGELFVTRNVPVDRITVTEGSLLIATADQLAGMQHRLTPSALFAINKFRGL
jgi:8-oxo-dGTP pyrophosphatase MutT (NUDIX family)